MARKSGGAVASSPRKLNTAAKGRKREWRTRDLLLAEHARHVDCCRVIRSAGSKGFADLVFICFACHLIKLVQVKTNRAPSKAEIAGLDKIHAQSKLSPLFVEVELWVWRDRDPEPERIQWPPIHWPRKP